jgi:hypothetical protein
MDCARSRRAGQPSRSERRGGAGEPRSQTPTSLKTTGWRIAELQETQTHLDAHAKAIDDLHAKLAADPNVDKAKLDVAVTKYKRSFAQFTEDAQACVSAR